MPKLGPNQIPSHQCRKSGGGLVVLSGQYFYTGKFGTPESDAEYNRQVAAWIARGRTPEVRSKGITIRHLADAYLKYAKSRFVKRGKPTSYVERIRRVTDEMIQLYGSLAVADFGPKKLMELRTGWIRPIQADRKPICKNTANSYSTVIIEMFRWGVSQELFPSELASRLQSLNPIRAHDGAMVYPPKTSASEKAVETILESLPPIPRLILQLMRVSSMRPSEACCINIKDLDMTGEVWEYRVNPEWNKTIHHGRQRIVFIGPKGQALLKQRLSKVRKDGYFFPTRHRDRPDSPYLAKSLGRIVSRHVARHGLTRFTPNQLRHSGLTAIRAAMGVEHAKSVAGHSSVTTTAIYIDPAVKDAPDREAARAAALAMG